MSTYLLPIESAILIFPILAALITIPYIIVQYRRYGSILPMRIVIVYSFIFYLLCAYFLVILPLPPMDEVANYTTPTMQLIPFEGYREFTISTSLVLNDPSTYWAALNEPSLFLIVFNILLTVPFGVFLRYYFEYSWKKTLLFSFLLTLSFESIQLSALFGIYPRPYRLFDVDDILNNTLGGMIGYCLTPLLVHFLPTRKEMDESSFYRGQMVSPLRRLFAFFIDLFIIGLLCCGLVFILIITDILSLRTLSNSILYIYLIVVLTVIVVLSLCTRGRTFGKAVVKIGIVNKEGTPLKWYQQLSHYSMIYLCILPCPYIIFLIFVDYFDSSTPNTWFTIVIACALLLFYIISILQCLRTLFRKDCSLWFDKRWDIHNISMLYFEESPTKKEETPSSLVPPVTDTVS